VWRLLRKAPIPCGLRRPEPRDGVVALNDSTQAGIRGARRKIAIPAGVDVRAGLLNEKPFPLALRPWSPPSRPRATSPQTLDRRSRRAPVSSAKRSACTPAEAADRRGSAGFRIPGVRKSPYDVAFQ